MAILRQRQEMGPIGRFLNRTIVPPSLFWRSILIVVLPLVIFQIVITVIFYNRHWDVVTRWLATGVAGEVALAVELLEEAPTAEDRRRVLARFREFHDLRLSLEPGGDLAAAVRRAGIGERRLSHIDAKIWQGFEERLDNPFAIDLRSEMPRFVVAYVQLDIGLLRVLAPAHRVTATTTQLLLYWMVGASLILITIAIYYIRLQVRPIRDLARAVESFGRGEDVGDFRPRGPSEIRRAAAAFNLMRERIIRHIGQRTEMLAAISHDLRTPLTRMRLELEMLGSDDPMARGLEADVDDLIELVDTYLAFARGEEGEAAEAVDLEPMLEQMAQRAQRAGATTELDVPRGITSTLRPVAFRRCLANLVDNAARYGKWVKIAAERKARNIQITIEDDGPGIPEALREAVFQPFFRIDTARRRQTGGTGLGLSIARDIVLGHGGDLRFETGARGGAKAVLRLPA
jgi:two-component system, OmpR family, osmolarity sensor histidine kinase EnvZ